MAARTVVTCAQWKANFAVRTPGLDGWYFLTWAHDVASGDVLGRGGIIHGEPFLLNPLYAYVIAPLVGAFGVTPPIPGAPPPAVVPVLVFQILLAGATTALAAAAARRFAGNAAAWTAGIAVAFSAPLVHLDCYVAVSGLAAFLVAGTCFACAPRESESERGHGPLAAGLWLGLSALARPVTLFALPFVVWLFVRRGPGKLRAAALVVLPFAACAGLSFARNVAVSGEPIVYTGANGLNLHLGNNEAARKLRFMTTHEFQFDPLSMHEDAQYIVGSELGRKPTRGEISAYFQKRAVDELRERPGESIAFYGNKTRWFFSPAEPASSADIDWDRGLTKALGLAFVPTWLVAALAAAGAVACRDRRDLLLGPGALVLAHVAACTLTFPLSHYRGPAVPAMAVLAGCAVAAALDGLRAGKGRAPAVVFVATVVVAVVGMIPPQPMYQEHTKLANVALGKRDAGDYDGAERDLLQALEVDPQFLGAKRILVDVGRGRRRPDLALPWAEQLVAAQPWNPEFQIALARVESEMGRTMEARGRLDAVLARYPWSEQVRREAGTLRLQLEGK